MYSSALITQTFLSLLLFQLQGTTMAKGDSGLMRLRAQTRSLADSPLSETFLSSDDHLTPEEIYKPGLATAYPGQQEQDQQSWLQQVPVETILTDCTSTTDESEQSLLPSAKFQRRQTKVQNACTPEWKPQPGQQKLNLDGQGQESGQTRPDSARDGQGRVLQSGELSKWNTYPSATELFRFNMFGRVGDSDPICDGFVGQSVPICAPFSLSGLSSPAPVLAPCRFWGKADLCISVIEQFWCCSKGREFDPDRILDDNKPWNSPARSQKIPLAYPAAGWDCTRSDDRRAFRI